MPFEDRYLRSAGSENGKSRKKETEIFLEIKRRVRERERESEGKGIQEKRYDYQFT